MNIANTIHRLTNNDNEALIAAGPCSASPENAHVIWELANENNIGMVRIVGVKSRTALDENSFMGWDYPVLKANERRLANNLRIIQSGKNLSDILKLEVPESIRLSKEIHEKTGTLIATEIMVPSTQIPVYNDQMPNGSMLFWTPSVNGLGWMPWEIQNLIGDNGHGLGIKNVKFAGDASLEELQNTQNTKGDLHKTWMGQAAYGTNVIPNNTILIHRGVSVEGKGAYRNAPVHGAATKVRIETGLPMLYDPSHIHGGKLRDDIVKDSVDAMRRTYIDPRTGLETFLYSGLLLEVIDNPSNVKSDADQHISLDEVYCIQLEIAKYRDIVKKGEG